MKKEILKEIIDNSKKLIGYKTTKDNFSEFDNAFNYIKEQLDGYFIKEIYAEGYNNLIVTNTKENNFDIVFCTHIDVVPGDESLFDAKELDGKLYGRGSFDMKSQVSVIISLLKNNKTDKKIAFMITSDEEIGGKCCKEIIKDYNSLLAIIPDGGKNFDLIVEEKGLLQLEFTAKGTTAHASEPYKGDNAIVKLIKLYEYLCDKYKADNKKDFFTTVNLSKLNGGIAVNMVPGEASMVLDIRFVKEDSVEDIIKDIKNYSKDIEFKILDEGPSFYADSDNYLIKEFICNAKEVLGRDVKLEKCVATCDAVYFSEKNIPTIIMNPEGGFWHGPDEYVEIDSLYTLYKIFQKML